MNTWNLVLLLGVTGIWLALISAVAWLVAAAEPRSS
jgi:hypothetical protein